MKVFVQWLTSPVAGWVSQSSDRWGKLDYKDPPAADRIPVFANDEGEIVTGFTGTPLNLDHRGGWINRLHFLTLDFAGDHVALMHHSDHIEIVVWNDDPGDFDPGNYDATIWRFYNEIIERQFKDGSGILTFGPAPLQEKEMYLGPTRKSELSAAGLFPQYTNSGLVKVHDWADFELPDPDLTRHGAWLEQGDYEAHQAIERPHFDNWEDWF